MTGDITTTPNSIGQLLHWLNGQGLNLTDQEKAAEALHQMYLTLNSPLTNLHGMSGEDLLDMIEGDGVEITDPAKVAELLDLFDL